MVESTFYRGKHQSQKYYVLDIQAYKFLCFGLWVLYQDVEKYN